MNIYLVSRKPEVVDRDQYDSLVVIAETIKEARSIYPDNHFTEYWYGLSVKLIGTAKKGIKKGIILGSFNAG